MRVSSLRFSARLGAAALLLSLGACAETNGEADRSTSQRVASEAITPSAVMDQQSIYQAMQKVADWQLASYNPETNLFEGYEEGAFFSAADSDSHPQGWVYAALHVGMARWAKLAEENGDPRYFEWQAQVAAKGKYLFSPRIYNADDYAIGQLYLDLYEREQNEDALVPLKVVFEMILHTPSSVDLRFEKVEQPSEFHDGPVADYFAGREAPLVPCKNRWCWADALFMGPPVWFHLAQVTGDDRYAEFADKEFWQTIDLLWDEEDHLFFRDTRFFDRREPNGEKVIWARGVGWVAAGLARILERLPADHPRRADYEDIFRKMMTRLAAQQQDDGLWRPSVLDPDTKPFKETSGTALMGFAFASGINQGVLDEATFRPVTEKAWAGLIDAIQPDGKLGWVQQIGAKPDSVDENDSQLYAVGAFLAMGTEMHRMVGDDGDE